MTRSMTYISVRWHHQHPGYPVHLFSELDGGRVEVRKVEVFADGRMRSADKCSQTGDTFLSVEPIPPVSEIASDAQFSACEISAAEFDAAWSAATGPGTG